MTATKIFEINATYKTYETGTVVKVLSRSMNSLTIQLASGETLQKRFKLNDDGVEFLQLSKWETVYADDVCDEDFQFTITVQACVLFTVTVDNGSIINVEYGDESLCAAFIGQHNISDDNDLSVFDGYLESALKIFESDGLMISIDRKYGNGGSRIARVELVQSLIGREVVFQKKHHATVIHEFKAEDDVDREYGEDWIKIQFDNGKITSLAKDAKTLQYL